MSEKVCCTSEDFSETYLLEEYNIPPIEKYNNFFLHLVSKYRNLLNYTILDYDDIIAICKENYYIAVKKYIAKVEKGYTGCFESYFIKICKGDVWEQLNTHKKVVYVKRNQIYKNLEDLKKASESQPTYKSPEENERQTGMKNYNEKFCYLEEYLGTTGDYVYNKMENKTEEEVPLTELLCTIDSVLVESTDRKIMGYIIKGYTYKEIASVLNMHTTSVARKVQHIREKIKINI